MFIAVEANGKKLQTEKSSTDLQTIRKKYEQQPSETIL
jgi:hypothetical protein